MNRLRGETLAAALALMSLAAVGWSTRAWRAEHPIRAPAARAEHPPGDCTGPTPEGGWAPWAFDEDGFKPYTMTLASAQDTYGFEMPSAVPHHLAVVDDMVSVVYLSGIDYTVHVLWQQPSRRSTGETVTMYVRHGGPSGSHAPVSVWWSAPGSVEYELASIDPDVGLADLAAMACSMRSYAGPCE